MSSMTWVLHCDCGTELRGPTEDEFVENVFAHARHSHAMTMTREQVLALGSQEGESPAS